MEKIITAILILVPMLWGISFSFKPISYGYQSSDFGFTNTEIPNKGRHLELVERQFESYKKEINNPNMDLYRTTKRNPLWITEWHDYMTHRRWDYEYREKMTRQALEPTLTTPAD